MVFHEVAGVALTLATSSGDGSGWRITCSQWSREPADEANFLIFGVVLNRESSLET
jgi:hypothetical protein